MSDYDLLVLLSVILAVIVVVVLAVALIEVRRRLVRISSNLATLAGALKGVEAVRANTDELAGIARINDSGVRILRSARAVRKTAVGK